MPNPVIATFSSRSLAAAASSAQLRNGLSGPTKKNEVCWISTPKGAMSSSRQLCPGSACRPMVSAVITDTE